MKSNTRAEVLEAWDSGRAMFWFWNNGEFDPIEGVLTSIEPYLFEVDHSRGYHNCSIEDPREKKKTRPMTNLEVAYFKGERKVFGYDTANERGCWFTEIYHENCEYTHYAEILDEGKRVGPWKPLEVEDNE